MLASRPRFQRRPNPRLRIQPRPHHRPPIGIIGSVVNGGVFSTGVGIWTGVFIVAAGVFILILNWVKSVRLWALVALCTTVVATAFAIIEFSINARRVQLASDAGIFGVSNSRVASIGGLPAAQLALGIVVFLLCLAFIGLYIYIAVKVSSRRSDRQQQQQIVYPVQQP
ncbi:unnamed protein product [Adineta steineri]|uniref:Uncharacterized protein n=1 Tax=Adineta steineri TaxID=433720 RepID=A0A816E3L0_9BILA|nr:unnamed protein product [Adineta steineri]CAF1644812.1 unnamed protein product [Adineta steineri]